jgi:hypothetical protein
MNNFDPANQEAVWHHYSDEFKLSQVLIENATECHCLEINSITHLWHITEDVWHLTSEIDPEGVYTVMTTKESQAHLDKLVSELPVMHQITKDLKLSDVKDGEYIDFESGCTHGLRDGKWTQWDGGYGIEVSEEQLQEWLTERQR